MADSLLRRKSLGVGGKMIKNQLSKFHFLAGVIYVDSNQTAFFVIIQYYALRDFFALRADMRRKIDVQRISVGLVVYLHGLNPRSGNAL